MLTVVILTFNEDRHLARCLDSIRQIANRIVIVDSFSTDDTLSIAKEYGCAILQNKFVNQAVQFQWGLEHAEINTPWVMRLDADEVLEADLQAEISQKLPTLDEGIAGVNLKRKHIFMERWIRHGGRYPLLLLRIWRNGQGRVENRWMDEHIVVWGGRTVTFDGNFADHNLNDLSYFTDKHNKYATREAIEVINQKHSLFEHEKKMSVKSTSKQAAAKRCIKENLYNKLPFWLAPLGYFLFRYIIQFGFLDGKEGLIYHFLQGFWYRFLVGAKVEELELAMSTCRTTDSRRLVLETITGYKLGR